MQLVCEGGGIFMSPCMPPLQRGPDPPRGGGLTLGVQIPPQMTGSWGIGSCSRLNKPRHALHWPMLCYSIDIVQWTKAVAANYAL